MGLIDSIKNSKLVQTFTPKDIEGTFDDGTGKFYIHYNGLPIGTADITADVNEGVERSATVRITAGLLTKDVSIIQEGKVKPEPNIRWVYGINPAPKEAWKQLFPEFYTTYYLPWDPSYNWFDCNKNNPSNSADNPIEDGNLCWAAATSNLIHWWILNNKKYIDMYGDKYKGPDYTYPLDKQQESDIFQLFISTFENEAGKTDEGVNWFIHGKKIITPSMRNPDETAGFFKDVFPEGVLLGANHGGLSKEVFNQVIKEALDNKRSIGIVIGNVQSSHAVVIWGVEFDEEGYISYMYMADNNDRDWYEEYGVGCIRLEIVYVDLPEGGTMTHYKTGFIGSDVTSPVSRLVTLDLGEKYWKQYFGIE